MNTRTIEVALGIQPIKYYIQGRALNAAARLKANEDWIDTIGLVGKMHAIAINILLLEKNIHINMNRDELSQNIIVKPNYKTIILNKEEWLKKVRLEVTPTCIHSIITNLMFSNFVTYFTTEHIKVN